MSKKILILYFQFILISLTLSQEIIPISIGQTIQGEFPLDESHKYYSLKIPKNASNHLLIITTHEDSSTSANTRESFSDPDFYISKKNKYPSSKRSAEWLSEQYGADIMSIPAESVNENDIFYDFCSIYIFMVITTIYYNTVFFLRIYFYFNNIMLRYFLKSFIYFSFYWFFVIFQKN